MKREYKGFVAGLLVAGVIAGTIGTAGAVVGRTQAALDYNNIKISLNGQTITPKDANGNTVEPFAINGTTYLPVRAVGEALGLDVQWNGDTKTVLLKGDAAETDLDAVQLMGFYKILSESFDDLVDVAEALHLGTMQGMVNDVVEDASSEHAGETYGDVVKGNLSDDLSLVEDHYNNCRPLLSDDDIALMGSYKSLTQRIIGYIDSAVAGQAAELPSVVWLDCNMGTVNADIGFWRTYQNAFD